MDQTSHANKTAYITMGLMMGAAAGIIAGMLTAPRSGRETRARIRMQSLDARDRAMDKVDEALHKTKGMAKTMADKTVSRAKRAADKAQTEADNRTTNEI